MNRAGGTFQEVVRVACGRVCFMARTTVFMSSFPSPKLWSVAAAARMTRPALPSGGVGEQQEFIIR